MIGGTWRNPLKDTEKLNRTHA